MMKQIIRRTLLLAIVVTSAAIAVGAPAKPADTLSPKIAKAIDGLQGTDLWSIRPIQHVQPPADPSGWSAGPIDQFVHARQVEHGLKPVDQADRRTLIRRVYFDLIGLPPSPAEVEAFVNDKSPDAWAKLVDHLLASPAYGERWGRHWLDVVRYADTAGDNSDYPIPQAYLYRDYVIDAFNHDKPYNEFIKEQIAGDLMPNKTPEARREHIIATGYIALSRRFGSQIKNYPQYLTISDTIDNLGKGILGLTLNCARCHDHKYDPVSNEDYYALYGIFNSTQYPFPGIELLKAQKYFVSLEPQDKVDAILKPFREKVAAAQKKLDDIDAQRKQATHDAIAAMKERSANKDPKKKDELDKKVTDAKDREAKLRKEYVHQENVISKVQQTKPHIDDAYAVSEGPDVGPVHVQIKGQPNDKGPLVKRHFLTALGGQTLPKDEKGSGRRELAEWITAPTNPLTSRVIVNRVWQYLLGQGIVATPDDFGTRGKPPTHPKLLDFLATRFMAEGWSIKKLVREIVMSKTYRLASTVDDADHKADPTNLYIWRARVRRLDAEAIRDAMLAVSGDLDSTPMHQPHPFPDPKTWNFTQHRPFHAVYDTNKRSVYMMVQRQQVHPFLSLFDGADTNACTGQRTCSTTTLQALYFLNDPFVHKQADAMAKRIESKTSDAKNRVQLCYESAYARPPSKAELNTSLQFIQQVSKQYEEVGSKTPADATNAAWASYCRVILRSNEFLFED